MKAMKHFYVLFLLFLLLLPACSKSPYEVVYEHETFIVDPVKATVAADDYVCSYTVTEKWNTTFGKNGIYFEVTYPDGSKFWRLDTGPHGTWGHSDDYRASRYIDGDILYQVLAKEVTPDTFSAQYIFPGLLLIAIGLFSIANPYASWYLSHGWHYKNTEPSEASLAANRFGGVFAVIVGILCFFI